MTRERGALSRLLSREPHAKSSTQPGRLDQPLPSKATLNGELEARRTRYTLIIAQQETTLIRAARRLCGSGKEDQAQDLVQDTLIKGYAAFVEGRFEEGSNARAWLLRILTNNYITDYNRRQKWEASIDVDTLTSDGAAGPESLRAAEADRPEEALMAPLLDEPLETALNALPHDLRACVVLVDIEEMTYEEVATALQVPIGTVRSRLFRARQQLHALLYTYGQQHRHILS